MSLVPPQFTHQNKPHGLVSNFAPLSISVGNLLFYMCPSGKRKATLDQVASDSGPPLRLTQADCT